MWLSHFRSSSSLLSRLSWMLLPSRLRVVLLLRLVCRAACDRGRAGRCAQMRGPLRGLGRQSGRLLSACFGCLLFNADCLDCFDCLVRTPLCCDLVTRRGQGLVQSASLMGSVLPGNFCIRHYFCQCFLRSYLILWVLLLDCQSSMGELRLVLVRLDFLHLKRR